LTVSRPRDHFDFRNGTGYLFIAGGIGITSMVAETERRRDRAAPPHTG
jgi:predicted ferric reductase